MDTAVFSRIQKNLSEKRKNLTDWLRYAPTAKRETVLGPADEGDVQLHLDTIDTALEKAEDQTLGLCEVCHGTVEYELMEMDYTTCVCLDHLSEMERRGLETELEFMQAVQMALLPTPPVIPGLDLAVFSRPAQMVSGDYYDFFQFGDAAPGMAVADAMGHGIAASMLMTGFQTALRTLAPESRSPVEVLQRINRAFLHNSKFTTFLTALVFKYDPAARALTYSNAGHNPPLLYRRQEREIARLAPTGAGIGLVENYPIAEETIPLVPGDMLLLYTDGVTEAVNSKSEPFGTNRLADLVRDNAALSAQDLVRTIRRALFDFSAGIPLADDITLVACKAADGSLDGRS